MVGNRQVKLQRVVPWEDTCGNSVEVQWRWTTDDHMSCRRCAVTSVQILSMMKSIDTSTSA